MHRISPSLDWIGLLNRLRRMAEYVSPAVVVAIFGFDLALPYSPWRHAAGMILADKLLFLSALVKVVEPLRIAALIRTRSAFNVPLAPVVAGMVSYESWTTYGLWYHNPVVFLPQGAGMLLAAAQTVLLLRYGAGPPWMYRASASRHVARDPRCPACRSISPRFPGPCRRSRCKGLAHVSLAPDRRSTPDALMIIERCARCGAEASFRFNSSEAHRLPLSEALFEPDRDPAALTQEVWRGLTTLYGASRDSRVGEARRLALQSAFLESLHRVTLCLPELGGSMRVERDGRSHELRDVVAVTVDEPPFTITCQLRLSLSDLSVIDDGPQAGVQVHLASSGAGDWVWEVASLYVSLEMTAVRRTRFDTVPRLDAAGGAPPVLSYRAASARGSVAAATDALLSGAADYAASRDDVGWRRRFWKCAAAYYIAAAAESFTSAGRREATARGLYAFGEAVVALASLGQDSR